MAEPDSQRARGFPPQLSLPRFQFSLWWLMVLVTVVAVFLGVAAVVGDAIVWLLFTSIVMCVAPTPLLIGALFGRGDIRAFAVGAVIPWFLIWSEMSIVAAGSWMTGRALVVTIFLLVTGTLCGVVAVATRRWIDRGTR